MNIAHETCPICGSNSARVRRRQIDHLISAFVLVHRYKCLNYHCTWKGNIRKTLPKGVV